MRSKSESVEDEGVIPAGAVARQDHYSNGSVLLSFDVYMMAPQPASLEP